MKIISKKGKFMKSSRTENRGYSQTSNSSRSSTAEALQPNLGGSQKSNESSQVIPLKPVLTHEQIEERAKALWNQHGRPHGQDQADWFEAEAQLRAELS
jgi:hypothetical protein